MPLDPVRRANPLPRLAADPLSRITVALMLLGMSPGGPVEVRDNAAGAATAQARSTAQGTAERALFPFR